MVTRGPSVIRTVTSTCSWLSEYLSAGSTRASRKPAPRNSATIPSDRLVERHAIETGGGLDAELGPDERDGFPPALPRSAAFRTRACGPAAISNVSVVWSGLCVTSVTGRAVAVMNPWSRQIASSRSAISLTRNSGGDAV